MIKVALIGIGSMGNVHYKSYKDVKNAKLVAVCDPRVELAKSKVDDESIKIYASFDELFEKEDFDVVDICTPSYMHADMAVKALEAGKHVLLEKPMSLTAEDTDKIIAAASKTDKMFMTAHVVRFMSAYVYLKKVIDSKELGEIVRYETRRFSGIPKNSCDNWMHDCEKSGGTPIDLAIHDLDFIQYVFGEPKEISSVYKKMENKNDYVSATLTYDNFTASVSSGWYHFDTGFKAEYFAVFENGCVECRDNKVFKNGEEVDVPRGTVCEDDDFNASGADGYLEEIVYFLECVENNQKPTMVTPESSKLSVVIGEKVIENAIII